MRPTFTRSLAPRTRDADSAVETATPYAACFRRVLLVIAPRFCWDMVQRRAAHRQPVYRREHENYSTELYKNLGRIGDDHCSFELSRARRERANQRRHHRLWPHR